MEIGTVKNQSSSTVARLQSAEGGRPAVVVTEEPSVESSRTPGQQEAERSDTPRSQVESAVSAIQEFVQSVRRNLDFSVDDSSGRVVVKVTDRESGDVIRQMPTEEALKLAESLEEVRSLLFRAEA